MCFQQFHVHLLDPKKAIKREGKIDVDNQEPDFEEKDDELPPFNIDQDSDEREESPSPEVRFLCFGARKSTWKVSHVLPSIIKNT